MEDRIGDFVVRGSELYGCRILLYGCEFEAKGAKPCSLAFYSYAPG